jgi:Zn-dependent protease with chaperone function
MDEPVPADLFDGVTALRHPVTLRWQAGGLEVGRSEGVAETIPDAALSLIEHRGDRLVYGHRDRKGWRLQVPVDAPTELLGRMPQGGTYGRWIDRIGLIRASLVLGAVSAVAVAAVMTAPSWLGPRIPESWEQRIGSALVGDLTPFTCSTPESDAALAALVGEVDDGQTPVTVQIANVDMVNAVALPGGRVLIFDKLVQEATSPDEIAGVLAHEVGHVRKRHVMQALLRQFGLSILLSGANSDVGGTLGGVAAMGYSRDAEREADAYSRMRLAAADISPAATAAFFGRLRKLDPTAGNKQLSYLNSHPDTAEREQAFKASVRSDEAYRPALTPAQFKALREACAKDPDSREWSLSWGGGKLN